jgi:hypothetical protein
MPFWKRVHDAPPSGVATEEEIIEKSCEEYLDCFYGKPFPFVKCSDDLNGSCNFNPITYNDPSEDAVVDLVEQNLGKEEEDAEKKPAAINNIAAFMGDGLTWPIGNKKEKISHHANIVSLNASQGVTMMKVSAIVPW